MTTNAFPSRFLRIGLASEMATEYGLRIRNGALEYAAGKSNWEIYLIRKPGSWDHIVPAERFDGLIVQHNVSPFKGYTGPVVHICGDPGEVDGPRVTADNLAVGRMAAEHFLEAGFRQLAYYGLAEGHKVAMARLEGLRQVAATHEVPVHVMQSPGRGELDTRPVHQWLCGLPKPIGVLVTTDYFAADLARMCDEAGIAVPEQIALLGIDDDEHFCRSANPPLSSIDHGAKKIGFEAARLLDRVLTGEKVTDPVIIPPVGVVRRRSTDFTAIQDPLVASAVRFIREYACEGVNVSDVCRAVSMSRRSLEVAFKRSIRRTIHQEIHRVRVSRALELLAWTDMPIADICIRAGFSYPSRFSAVIHREIGQTPSEYRRRHRGV